MGSGEPVILVYGPFDAVHGIRCNRQPHPQGMPVKCNAVNWFLRSIAAEGHLRSVLRVADELDITWGTSCALRSECDTKVGALPSRNGSRKYDTAHRISFSAPGRRPHCNAGVARREWDGLTFCRPYRDLTKIQSPRGYGEFARSHRRGAVAWFGWSLRRLRRNRLIFAVVKMTKPGNNRPCMRATLLKKNCSRERSGLRATLLWEERKFVALGQGCGASPGGHRGHRVNSLRPHVQVWIGSASKLAKNVTLWGD